MEPEEPKIEFIISKKNKTQLINYNKYIYIFYTKDVSGDTTCRWVNFKKICKCPSLIKLDINKNIIKYEKYHNHIISNKEPPKRKSKSEIKKLLKPQDIYKESTKNLGLIIPEYKTVKSNINLKFSKENKTWEQKP